MTSYTLEPVDYNPFEQVTTQPRVENSGKSAIIGAAQGASAYFGDELMAGLTSFGVGAAKPFMRLAGYSETELPNNTYDTKLQELRQGNQQAFEDAPAAYTAGAIGGSIAGVGKLAAPFAATKIGGKIATATLPTASGRLIAGTAKVASPAAVSGAVAGFGSGEGGFDKRMAQAKDDAVLSAAFGVGLKGAKEIVAPTINSANKPLAQRAKQLGIPLSVTQIVPSRVRNTVQKISQNVPFNGVDNFQEKQVQLWNKAVAKTLGVNSDNLSPNVINDFVKQNSNKFNNVLKGTQIKVSNDILDGIVGTLEEAKQSVPTDLYQVINNNAEYLLKNIDNNGINGEKVASFRSSMLSAASNAPREAKKYINDLVNLVDEQLTNNLPENAQKALKQARNEYRNFKTIEPLLEKSTDGNINPTQLMQRVASSKYIRSSSKKVGDDDLVDLARIGKQFLPKVGGSDTVPNLLVGGGVGTGIANPTMIAPIVGGVAANRGYQSLYNQAQPVVNKLIDGVGNVPAAAIGAGVAAQPDNQQQAPNYNLEPVDYNPFAQPLPNNPDGVSPQQEPLTLEITPQSQNTQLDSRSFTQQNEGRRLQAYTDTTGNKTIGDGFNFNSGIAAKVWKKAGLSPQLFNQAKRGEVEITPYDADMLHQVSYNVASDDAKAYYPDFDNLSPSQKEGLTDLAYQVGLSSLKQFTGLKKALQSGDLNAIMKHSINSKVHEQTPERNIARTKLLMRLE